MSHQTHPALLLECPGPPDAETSRLCGQWGQAWCREGRWCPGAVCALSTFSPPPTKALHWGWAQLAPPSGRGAAPGQSSPPESESGVAVGQPGSCWVLEGDSGARLSFGIYPGLHSTKMVALSFFCSLRKFRNTIHIEDVQLNKLL